MKNKLLAGPYLVWMILFTLVPLGIVVYYAFTSSTTGAFTLVNLAHIGTYLPIFLRSIGLAAVASLICLVIGYPVAYCIAHNTVLEKLPLETFRTFSDLFDDGVYDAIDLTNCVTRRVSYGGTSVPSVEAQITWVTQQLGE